jgi:peptidoglycan/xylan/chitin deacetylase (PgdA/CDA1 family)
MIEKLKQNMDLWDLFTKREEYSPPILDKYDRFPYYLSKHRNIFVPEVSKFLIENGLNLEVEYPEGKNFAVCLTHDIDGFYLYTSKLGVVYNAVKSLKEHQIKTALKIPFYKINKNWNPLCNFKDIMELEEKYDAKSSFYFLTLNKGDLDFNFKVEDLEHEIGNIADKGWEVGLHGGHEAYNNLDELEDKKKRLEKVLGKKVSGYRNHFLKFKVPDTWVLLSKAGFKYDSTFGYADCVGFRNGMCHPFRPFNLNTGMEIDILEIPLAVMDDTLFKYMKLDMERAWKITKLLIDTVEKYSGVITILWHNTYMVGEMLKFYEKILKHCYEKGGWMTSGEEIWKWRNKVLKVDGNIYITKTNHNMRDDKR